MRLDQFVWSRNPRGLHVQRVLITPLEYNRWTDPQMGWVKLVAANTEYIDDSMDFLALNVTPIVRFFRDGFGASPMDQELRSLYDAYINAGVKWFEFYNEPNLGNEWPAGTPALDYRNTGTFIAPMMDNWLVWAEYLISRGAYPGFVALAEADSPTTGAVGWMDAMLNYMATVHYDRFRNVLANGAYCATHPYILNHFYQEQPGGGPTSTRPPSEQVATEGGWHFEYPYDPISQAADPGRTVYGGTALTPNGDPNGLIAMGRMFNERCASLFGTQAVPVVGTEGGIWPFRDGGGYQPDTRYPPYTTDSQAEATVAMFNWIATSAPEWFFGVALWKEDEYYPDGPVRAINRLREVPPAYKTVPPIEVMGPGYTSPLAAPPPIPGPGPVHGEADFHLVILAPGIETRWFFDVAQAYWNTFRPIVTNRIDLIGFVPSDYSLAATVLAPPSMVEVMSAAIREAYPNVYLDVIATDREADVELIFNLRVTRSQRFG